MKLTSDQHQWFSGVQADWGRIMQPGAQPLGSHLFDEPQWLVDAAVENGRLFGSRSTALNSLPKGGIIAELGTQAGRYARQILDVCRPAALHLFDLEFGTLEANDPEIVSDARTRLHLGDSSTNLSKMPNGSFDWIYIDGDHSRAGVQKDADCASSKIKVDGTLVFNDYTLWSPMELTDYGIVPVVNGMLAGGAWEVVYLALHPLMYCDIAIRRRSATLRGGRHE